MTVPNFLCVHANFIACDHVTKISISVINRAMYLSLIMSTYSTKHKSFPKMSATFLGTTIEDTTRSDAEGRGKQLEDIGNI